MGNENGNGTLLPPEHYPQGSPEWYAALTRKRLEEGSQAQGVVVEPNYENPAIPRIRRMRAEVVKAPTVPQVRLPAPPWAKSDGSMRSKLHALTDKAAHHLGQVFDEEPVEVYATDMPAVQAAKIRNNENLRNARISAARILNRLVETTERYGLARDIEGDVTVEDVDRELGRRAAHGNPRAATVWLQRRGEHEERRGLVELLEMDMGQLSPKEVNKMRHSLLDELAGPR